MSEVYIATWQHYENFIVIGAFHRLEDALQACRDETRTSAGYPGNEPIIGDFKALPGQFLWHGSIRPDNDAIGYFVYLKPVK